MDRYNDVKILLKKWEQSFFQTNNRKPNKVSYFISVLEYCVVFKSCYMLCYMLFLLLYFMLFSSVVVSLILSKTYFLLKDDIDKAPEETKRKFIALCL